MKVIPTKFDIYVFITIIGSIPLLMDYQPPVGVIHTVFRVSTLK
jgi:hypothetical protein